MDNTYCCVPQCKTRGNAFPRSSFHHFPSSIQLRKQWILNLKIGKDVSKRMVVCGKHFKRSDFFPGEKKRWRLKRNAVPSQNLPVGWGSSGHEEIFIKENIVKKKRKNNFPPGHFGAQEPGSDKILNFKPKEIAYNKNRPVLVKIVNEGDLNLKAEDQNLHSGTNNSEFINVCEMNQNISNVLDSEIIEKYETCNWDSNAQYLDIQVYSKGTNSILTNNQQDGDAEMSLESEREMNNISENESSTDDSSCSMSQSSVNSKEEILQEKLKIMTEKYNKTKKKMKLYECQWKGCIKHIEYLKVVIQNLTEINATREDC